MKGFTKAIKRTPHMVTTKVGMSKKSADLEFDDYERKFSTMEDTVEKLLKDCKKFNEAVVNLFTAGQGFSQHFCQLFHPMVGEYDLIGKNPDAQDTIRNVDGYQQLFEELRMSITPELELIESRIVTPVKELQTIMKQIRKNITKRNHKLVDYDRFNNSLTKLRDKKEKSLSDEKNLFKLEQDFEVATNEYEYINNAMKQDLPRFMVLSAQFVDPLYNSFYYMQLNIFYMLMEKMSTFADGKYDIQIPTAQISDDYENRRSDAWQRIEDMNITKRIVSTAKMMQNHRQNSGMSSGTGSSLGRSNTAMSSSTTSSAGLGVGGRTMPPMARTPSASSYVKKAPPPPPSLASYAAAPPPYTPSSNGTAAAAAAAAATKRPPPPPPLKPKPRVEPPVQYVVALYDFTPQADGDLEFHVGDRIEVVKRTASTEDWWTGRLNGREGVFPGNYVQEA
ncbi:BAR-domain-containing protein [Fomitiporia mediterranea MF3/22]|uniref:BAR-domain-containing protein n=1 Tax=Fomitiporia mediterranea (strain MF3/22) TaxID=694068 RepID=UPI000440809C|nr:BAR-domain-containing protein [Fomitiporia mediterranea MF3/22]EJD04441.1 BAR-domain-containing protein [Fomitiporia mediterranea MF3/22]